MLYMYSEYSNCSDVTLTEQCHTTMHVLNMSSSCLHSVLTLIDQCRTCDTTLPNLWHHSDISTMTDFYFPYGMF